MRHLVYCRAVPDLENLSVSQSQGRVFEKGKRKLHPDDEKAVETALQARKPGDEVVVVAVGPDADFLKKALAMGADRALQVELEADGHVVANVLRRLGGPLYAGDPEIVARTGAVPGTAAPRLPNAMAIMKAARKTVEKETPDLSDDERTPRVVLRAEYLA